MEKLKHFETLNAINVNDKTELKSNGSTELTYLSWAWAWAEVKKVYPDATYEILKFGDDHLPYVFDEKTGYMVFTNVEIEGVKHEMWLPVMDSANKAMKDKPYTYKVKKWNAQKRSYDYIEKTVDTATMFDVNKTIMRCLTKNLAMFGLGLYIYAGEDLPENEEDRTTVEVEKETRTKKSEEKKELMIIDSQKEKIKELYAAEEIKTYLVLLKKSKLSELTLKEASDFIKAKGEK